MSVSGQRDLQATQEIIKLFESSKSHCEEALESLPGIYAVIDGTGSILKSNRRLADYYSAPHEELLGRQLKEIFSGDDWRILGDKFSGLPVGDQQGIEFQSKVMSKSGKADEFLWHVSRMQVGGPRAPILYSLIGRDVTDLNRATERNTRMQIELNTARTVQETLLPPGSARFGQSSISGHYLSASECGGDWWNYREIGGKLFLWVGDVTGHGASAAMVTSAIHAAASVTTKFDTSPSAALKVLNQAIGATTYGRQLVTVLVGVLDLASGSFTYSSAAHEPAILFPAGKQLKSMRDLVLLPSEQTVPLGSSMDVKYQEHRHELKRGDRLMFYSDGVYDVVSASGDAWARAVFRRNVVRLANESSDAEQLTNALKQTIEEFRQGADLLDDVTFFTFQY